MADQKWMDFAYWWSELREGLLPKWLSCLALGILTREKKTGLREGSMDDGHSLECYTLGMSDKKKHHPVS